MDDEDRTPAGLPPAPIGPEPTPRDDTITDEYHRRDECRCATVADLYLCAAVLAALQLLSAWLGYVFR